MKTPLCNQSRWIAAILSVFPAGILLGGGQVYTESGDIPRTSKTPQAVTLKSATGSESAFSVRAALAEIRLERAGTKGDAGMSGNLNVFRKFIRFDIRGVTALSKPANLKVNYSVKEGEKVEKMEDSVGFGEAASAYVVDTTGIEDVTGTFVESKTTATTITSTKYKHPNAEIVAVSVSITDKAGNVLYAGAWPEAHMDVVSLPERLKPRIFTAVDGRKIEATITAVTADTVTLQMNGKTFPVELSNLSEPDRAFLEKVRQTHQ